MKPKITQEQALKLALEEIKKMSAEELNSELERNRNGDIAVAMREIKKGLQDMQDMVK